MRPTFPSRIFGGDRVLCFVKRVYLGRSAAGIGQPVGSRRNSDCTDAAVTRQPRVILRLRSDWTRQLPARPVFTPPDVRTDDSVRRLAAARPPAPDPAAAPNDSPAYPFPGIGASWSRDNTVLLAAEVDV